jgi:ABC-type nitrate/sulfonate/bicarbonate transport system substrate-binding protein
LCRSAAAKVAAMMRFAWSRLRARIAFSTIGTACNVAELAARSRGHATDDPHARSSASRLELEFTDNSRNQREGLTAGRFEVAQSALDNAVAMIEVAKADVIIVGGGDSGMNEFFVQPEIKTFADLRGRTLIVDAPDTAYALQAKKILLQHGLKEGADYTVKPVGAGAFRFKAMAESRDNAAAILNLPFTVQAEQLGMRSLGRTVDLLGPYQAGGAFVMRAWARHHGATLERYLAGYVESLRRVREPANRTEAVALLAERFKLPQQVAERTHALLVDPSFGFNVDARFDRRGFATS